MQKIKIPLQISPLQDSIECMPKGTSTTENVHIDTTKNLKGAIHETPRLCLENSASAGCNVYCLTTVNY